MENNRVLIVGAGPTGMVLALQLNRYGVPFRIIDHSPRRGDGSKALSLHPLSLRLLADLGVAKELIDRGHKTRKLNLIYKNKRLACIDFDHLKGPHPYILMLPQPETENVLQAALEAKGIQIEFDKTLIGILDNSHTAKVEIVDSADGRSEIADYSYVVGCDGARSAVRNLLDAGFTGYDYGMHLLLADAKVSWDGPLDQGFYFVQDNAFFILLPLINGYHRIVAKVDGEIDKDRDRDFLKIREVIEKCGVNNLTIHEPIWLSRAPLYNRLASIHRKHRFFLAGDSSHLFSPIGGFGMNAGIGDAFNLGWRMGYTMRGFASDSILDSYADERRSIAKRLLSQTDKSTSMSARLHRHDPSDDSLWSPTMQNRSFKRGLVLISSGYSQTYEEVPTSATMKKASINKISPFALDVDDTNHGSLIGNGRHTLVYVPSGDHKTTLNVIATLSALYKSYRELLSIVIAGDLGVFNGDIPFQYDANHKLREKYELAENTIMLIRPDFYVEYVSSGERSHEEVLRYFANSYCATNV